MLTPTLKPKDIKLFKNIKMNLKTLLKVFKNTLLIAIYLTFLKLIK